ncbi:hypothetical protein [Methylococcus capsulatus]|jgi:hypothetical protein|uniref:hypothetical protein n=1 Tax=Methylococcus capsulatus TaxID=414 RepID=UPI0002EBB9B8|nr:hypothetical protein [Methylococcus capsulatus]QXP86253.1 hypothetical protein KW112_07350 [Methylococcus capsulatus]QXP89724.1 hypothetical protein KW114_11535 [Methylococcus capsulatus]QXP94076.1 hypothetical protein KW113_02290 [Methylococcus capsulatus]UQN11187.1 hypothetical protein M3M30_09090 [Methylococcus capsulatus]
MAFIITIEGEHAALASEDEIADGIAAAREVFARNEADPLACQLAVTKLEQDELLNREEALLCLIWDEAEEAAFRAVTLGWLSRAVDIKLAVRAESGEEVVAVRLTH